MTNMTFQRFALSPNMYVQDVSVDFKKDDAQITLVF